MKRIVLLLLFCVLMASCTRKQEVLLIAGDHVIPLYVEIADEPEEHARGLMFRESLSAGQGMLFIFPESAERSFWMKNTPIPLDVLFFDEGQQLVNVRRMNPCVQDPCPLFDSTRPAKYALEVNAGFFDEQVLPHLRDSGENSLLLRFVGE